MYLVYCTEVQKGQVRWRHEIKSKALISALRFSSSLCLVYNHIKHMATRDEFRQIRSGQIRAELVCHK